MEKDIRPLNKYSQASEVKDMNIFPSYKNSEIIACEYFVCNLLERVIRSQKKSNIDSEIVCNIYTGGDVGNDGELNIDNSITLLVTNNGIPILPLIYILDTLTIDYIILKYVKSDVYFQIKETPEYRELITFSLSSDTTGMYFVKSPKQGKIIKDDITGEYKFNSDNINNIHKITGYENKKYTWTKL